MKRTLMFPVAAAALLAVVACDNRSPGSGPPKPVTDNAPASPGGGATAPRGPAEPAGAGAPSESDPMSNGLPRPGSDAGSRTLQDPDSDRTGGRKSTDQPSSGAPAPRSESRDGTRHAVAAGARAEREWARFVACAKYAALEPEGRLDPLDGAVFQLPARTRVREVGPFLRVADKSDREAAPADGGAGKLSAEDRRFLQAAAGGGLYEVAVAALASQRAKDPSVKEFADMLHDHHGEANMELEALARSLGERFPKAVPKEKQAAIDALGKVTDTRKFETAFVRGVGVTDHQNDIAAFEKAAMATRNEALRAWIDKTLPTLRKHLAAAQQLAYERTPREKEARAGDDRAR